MSESLTFEKLKKLYEDLHGKLYKVQIGDINIDIRDYKLKNVFGVYVLHHINAIDEDVTIEIDSLSMPLKLKDNSIIFLGGCTEEIYNKLIETFPNLEEKL